MRVLAPVQAARLATWRERLRDPLDLEALARLAEEHPGLLLALLRRAGSLGLAARDRPLAALDACRLLGLEASRRLLHSLLLLNPEGSPTPWLDPRILALRETAAALSARLGDSGAPGPDVERVLRTALRLLELVPGAHLPAGAPEATVAWGEELLALCGGERWLHPGLAGALLALAGREASEEGERVAGLLRAAITFSGATARVEPITTRLDRRMDLHA
jgi:hypothetical protein